MNFRDLLQRMVERNKEIGPRTKPELQREVEARVEKLEQRLRYIQRSRDAQLQAEIEMLQHQRDRDRRDWP